MIGWLEIWEILQEDERTRKPWLPSLDGELHSFDDLFRYYGDFLWDFSFHKVWLNCSCSATLWSLRVCQVQLRPQESHCSTPFSSPSCFYFDVFDCFTLFSSPPSSSSFFSAPHPSAYFSFPVLLLVNISTPSAWLQYPLRTFFRLPTIPHKDSGKHNPRVFKIVKADECKGTQREKPEWDKLTVGQTGRTSLSNIL